MSVPQTKLPIILMDAASADAYRIFNPNDWAGRSRAIVQSCASELSTLQHSVSALTSLCSAGRALCETQIETIYKQWAVAPFEIDNCIFYAEQPQVHAYVESMLSGSKTLLDLLVQLLSTERVIGIPLHGFHRAKDVLGGSVLNALARTALKDRKETARRLADLLTEHKRDWIDSAIVARDALQHPTAGARQLMFSLDFTKRGNGIVCNNVASPRIGPAPADSFGERVLGRAAELSQVFLKELRSR